MRPLEQEAFDVELLQVDEGGALVAGLGQEVEAVDRVLVEEDLAEVPGDALVDHALAAAEAVEDLQGALGEADGAGAGGEPLVVVEQDNGHPALRQVYGCRQPHRPCADHDDRMPHRARRVLVR